MSFREYWTKHREERLAKKLQKQLAKDHEKFLALAKQDHESAVKAALTIIGYYEVTVDNDDGTKQIVTADDLPNMTTEDLLEICEYGIEQLRRLK